MARGTSNTNVFSVRQIVSREIASSTHVLKEINWKILRNLIISKNGCLVINYWRGSWVKVLFCFVLGFNLKEVDTFSGAKSCNRIVYCDGHLIIKDISTSKSKKLHEISFFARPWRNFGCHVCEIAIFVMK